MWKLFLLAVVVDCVYGQGRMLVPPGRSTMWRLGYDTPVNFNDNVLNCGGVKVSSLWNLKPALSLLVEHTQVTVCT